MARRLHAMNAKGYENGFQFTVLPERLNIPINTKKPTRFFVNSMSDLFHENMPFEFLDRIFETIKNTPQHSYQILTKREKIMQQYFANHHVPENVWLGVTVENDNSKERINVLKTIDAQIRFLSIEPLIGDVGQLELANIHWVIVGGESGNQARPMKKEWVQNIQQQCSNQSVAFFFKQWGTWSEDGIKRNKSINGNLLHGKQWKEIPKQLTIQNHKLYRSR
jgi:protein gp37